MYRNIFTSLIGVALLLVCVHSARISVERPLPASEFQSSSFNQTNAVELKNVTLPSDNSAHDLFFVGKDGHGSIVSNLSGGKNITGVGASRSIQGQFVNVTNGTVSGGNGAAGVTHFEKRRLSSGFDSQGEDQLGVDSSRIIDNGGAQTITNENFQVPNPAFSGHIVGTGGNGNAQGQFGNNANGRVEGGNGGNGVTIGKRHFPMSDFDIHGSGGNGNAQGQFGSDGNGKVIGGNGGNGVTIGKRHFPMSDFDIHGTGGNGNAQGQFGDDANGQVNGGNGGNGVTLSKRKLSRWNLGSPADTEGEDQGVESSSIIKNEDGGRVENTVKKQRVPSLSGHIVGTGGNGNDQGQFGNNAKGKVEGGNGGNGVTLSLKRSFPMWSFNTPNIQGTGGNGNTQGQFGNNANGKVFGGNGGNGVTFSQKPGFLMSGFNTPNIQGTGGNGNAQGQFGDNGDGQVNGGNGGNGVTLSKRKLRRWNLGSPADTEGEDQGVESSDIIKNDDGGRVEHTVTKQRVPATNVDLPENIDGKGGNGNDQGQFGDNSTGDVKGGNGGGGVTLSGKNKLPSKKIHSSSHIDGKGGNGNDQGQFGDGSTGKVIGGNGGSGVSLRR